MDTPRFWRKANSLLAASLLACAAGSAHAAITEIQPGDLAGAAVRPYTGPADPILHFTGGDGNPTVQAVASALGYTGPVDASHCTRVDPPNPDGGTVFVNGIVFNYEFDPATQSVYFNWDANAPVMWVTAKGGPDAYVFAYTYDVSPADGVADGELEDFALRSPAVGGGQPAGLSHFDFCFREPPPTIAKTAVGSWTGFNDWTLDKAADPDSIRMFDGDSHDVDYTITATKTPWGNYTVAGVIEISDPLDRGFSVDSVSDTIIFNADPAMPKTLFHPSLNCMVVNDASDVIYRCTYTITLSSKVHTFLAGGTGGVNAAAAMLSLNGNSMQIATTANFVFPATPEAEFGASLVVDDSMVPGAPDHTFNGSGVWTYDQTFVCPDNDGGNPNTATGTFSTGPATSGQVMANENVQVTCETIQISKTADTSFDVDFAWTGDKKIMVRAADLTEEEKDLHCTLITSGIHSGNYACDDITLILNESSVYDTEYQLNAVRSAGVESGWKVFGTISVSWPNDMSPVFTGNPTDTLHFASGLPATQNAVVSNCVAGAGSLVCDYEADLDSKRDGVNWASIERPHVCYDSSGGVIACSVPDSTTYQDDAAFVFGAPTTSTDECVAMSDLFNDGGLNLGPSFGWLVDGMICSSPYQVYVTGDVGNPVAGNLSIHADWYLDETAFIDNQCVFQVPNLLTLLTNDTAATSSDGAMINVHVPSICSQGCTLTQGYWKTHSKYGPAPYDETWAVIGEDTLFFNSGRSWYKTFWSPPKGGDAYLQLAHQYMAAKLSIEAGASVPAEVASALAQAEALFNAVGSKFNPGQSSTARQLAGLLDQYNNGEIGPGHCSEAPTRSVMMMR